MSVFEIIIPRSLECVYLNIKVIEYIKCQKQNKDECEIITSIVTKKTDITIANPHVTQLFKSPKPHFTRLAVDINKTEHSVVMDSTNTDYGAARKCGILLHGYF